MKTIDIEYINYNLVKEGCPKLVLERDSYPEVLINKEGTSLVDANGNNIGTKGDMYHKLLFDKILQEGCMDRNPRPHYEDGVKAHTLSINPAIANIVVCYDLSKGEFPITTLRPIACKSSIGEALWIYQDSSNNLELLKSKYGVTWWDEWDIGNRTIGATYGETVRRRDMVRKLLEEIEKDPDGRRHIINLWQVDDYMEPHGLKPCAFLTEWNVRHGRDGVDYLDLKLTQRSSDFATAGAINQVQYVALQYMFARHLGLIPGMFTWSFNNIQIYDRHINQVIEMLNRDPINCNAHLKLNDDVTNFYDFTVDDVKIVDYPRDEIKIKNKQLKFPIGI